MARVLTVILTTTLMASPALAKKGKGKKGGGRDLTMEAGTVQLGGNGTIDIFAAGGSTSVGVNLSPSAGYFVADSLEIFGGVDLGVAGGLSSWGLEAGGKYFIDVKPNWIYAGLGLGYGAVTVPGVNASVNAFTLSPQGGLLLPLGKNVGLDVGTRIDIAMSGGSTSIAVPLGFLGVQAFFD